MDTSPTLSITPRLTALRDEIIARKGSFVPDTNPFVRTVALWLAAQPGRSRVQVRAAYLLELVALAPILIESDWKLVGNHLPTEKVGVNIPDPTNPEHARQLQALGLAAVEI